jgi:integrase
VPRFAQRAALRVPAAPDAPLSACPGPAGAPPSARPCLRIGEKELHDFLSYLALNRKVAAATQKQAFNTLLFLFRNVLALPVNTLDPVVRARMGRKLPVVLAVDEVRAIIDKLQGVERLMVTIIYGAGLQLEECLSLRVEDVDFARGCLTIRNGKGKKDRETVLPESAIESLKRHLERVRAFYEEDRSRDLPGVFVPDALGRKCPGYGTEWGWSWLFPRGRLAVDPLSGVVRRYDAYPTTLQQALELAVARAGIAKNATTHTAAQFRYTPRGARLRHQDHTGITGTLRRLHDDDPHARGEAQQAWSAEPDDL